MFSGPSRTSRERRGATHCATGARWRPLELVTCRNLRKLVVRRTLGLPHFLFLRPFFQEEGSGVPAQLPMALSGLRGTNLRSSEKVGAFPIGSRLHGKENSLMAQGRFTKFTSMIKWIWTRGLSIKKSLSGASRTVADPAARGRHRRALRAGNPQP